MCLQLKCLSDLGMLSTFLSKHKCRIAVSMGNRWRATMLRIHSFPDLPRINSESFRMFQDRQLEPCEFGTFLGTVLKFRRGNIFCSSVSLMKICPTMVEKRHPNTPQLFSWVVKCSLPKMLRTLLQAGLLLAAGIVFYHFYVRIISQKLNTKNVNIHSGKLFWIWKTSASVGQWLTVCWSFFIQKESSWLFLQGLLISVAITSLSTNTLRHSGILWVALQAALRSY